MIETREYQDHDFDRLCEIHDKARFNELKISHLETAFKPLEIAAYEEDLFDYNIQVALKEGVLVGFVAYVDHELGWLYVDPQYAKQNVGKTLVDYVKEVYKDEVITLEVIATNTIALLFYKKMGFEIVRKQSGKMPGNESFIIDVYEMQYQPKQK